MTFALWFYAARANTFVRAITLAVHLATKNALIAGLKTVTPCMQQPCVCSIPIFL